MWPQQEPLVHLSDVVQLSEAEPLSLRATSGFYERTQRSSLRFNPAFIEDLVSHIDLLKTAEAA